MRFLTFTVLLAISSLVASAVSTDKHDSEGHSKGYRHIQDASTGRINHTVSPASNPHIEPRENHDIKCDLGSSGNRIGSQKNLKKAMKWLRKKRTKEVVPSLDAHKCETAVCAYGTRITWCNDNSNEKMLPSWINVAEGAQVILDLCKKKNNGVQGELNHNDHWRVIVTGGHECYLQAGPEQPV
ncbi:hypothetical protein AN7861.2 [Aspergillus nidulans FGSC A4]|uniref:Ecp2 effector protein domain-containing protein n=1 Tax=Emericella nidulans (strain FGSC A4 / ATCC 38163 / CBS 112.46 / NRRL 194 / M139) TaxID=227321 RepID=Q5AV19_EMENI|nr:hypothetical protein [Aspergillus nidulans FGSC A4]EAA58906.1 hypothetical protein AN7861.2 [Aspergillus nidulans FGSC A4]CBF73403.1 TPA: conserved hypothetical protein [Aspergillus nidulans FGSC A4]|eukprot:XP_681130.1 hypothetical protein AN7861.2 [Aspergillus nidulans FGSC A4]